MAIEMTAGGGLPRENARPRQCQLRHALQYAVRVASRAGFTEPADEPRRVTAGLPDRVATHGRERKPLRPGVAGRASLAQREHGQGNRRVGSQGLEGAGRKGGGETARSRSRSLRRGGPSEKAPRSESSRLPNRGQGALLGQKELELGA